MDDQAKRIEPTALDEADAPREGWDDSVRGRLHWRTLFSQGLTPSAGMTCGVAELGPATGWAFIAMRRRKSITSSPETAS